MNAFRAKRSVEQLLASVDNSVLRGDGLLNTREYLEPIETQELVDTTLIRRVLENGLERLDHEELEETTSLDQWLAPRIHSALRISRRLAGDMGFWSWLVIEVGRTYTWRRWAEKNRPTMYRYTGDFKRNSLGRLWWFAEMSRNGPDYSPIEKVLRDASTAQYAMELRYSMYRPAVIAFGNTASRLDLGFADLKKLSKRANAYLSLKALEAIGLDQGENERDVEWWRDRPVVNDVIGDAEMIGPQDGFASSSAIQSIEQWFESLTQEVIPTGVEVEK